MIVKKKRSSFANGRERLVKVQVVLTKEMQGAEGGNINAFRPLIQIHRPLQTFSRTYLAAWIQIKQLTNGEQNIK